MLSGSSAVSATLDSLRMARGLPVQTGRVWFMRQWLYGCVLVRRRHIQWEVAGLRCWLWVDTEANFEDLNGVYTQSSQSRVLVILGIQVCSNSCHGRMESFLIRLMGASPGEKFGVPTGN